MIKLIKLCFVCCLIFRATFVEAVITKEEAYEALKELEAEFLRSKIMPYYQAQLQRDCDSLAFLFGSIVQDVSNYLDPFYVSNGLPKLFDEPTPVDISENFTLDFSEASMMDIISMFYEILQCKAYYRDDRPGGYKTNAHGLIQMIKFDDNGYGYLNDNHREDEIIDPYFTKINIEGEEYHLHLNYSGKETSKQPGNCCLKLKSEDPEKWSNRGKYNTKLSDDEHYVLQNLLLCLEVSRRCVVDANRLGKNDSCIFEDEHCDLPILGAIVIGVDLINAQRITRDDFFAGDYRCFSDKRNENNCRLRKQQRATNIKNLLLTFLNYKKEDQNMEIQTADQFKKEVQELYRDFIGQKITDRIIHPTTLTDFLNDENICKSLKKRGFSFDVLKNSILSEKLKKVINRIEVPSNNKKASNGKGNKYKKNNLKNTSDKFLSKQNSSKEAKNDSKTENDESIYIWKCFKENTTKDLQGVSVSLFENGELGPSFSRKKYDYKYYRTALFRITGADNVTWLYLKNPELNSKNQSQGEIYLVDVH